MSDEPLRRFAERRDRPAKLLQPSRRSTTSILLGIALVGVAVAALFVLRDKPASEATAPITTGAVETALGPVVDLRTGEPDDAAPELPAESAREELALDDAPSNGLSRIMKVPRDAPARSRGRDVPVTPLPELVEDAPEGPLPRIADTGLTPFDAYRIADDKAAASRVAIVVGGMGLSQTGTQAAIEALPSAVTLAFSPDGFSIDRWTRRARREGHELALQVPLEPLGWPGVNTGRHTLTRDAGDNVETLREAMGRVFTYASVMPYSGTAFLPDEKALAPVMAEVAKRGLAWIDNGRSGRSRSAAVVASLRGEGVRLPSGRVAILLDDDRDAAAIDRQLDALAEAARKDGYAIGLASGFETSVERIALFARTAAKRGIRLVPASNLLR